MTFAAAAEVVDHVYTHEEGNQSAVEILDSLMADIEFPREMEDGDHLDCRALEVHWVGIDGRTVEALHCTAMELPN